MDDHHYQTDWQQICPDSSSLSVRRRQRGVAARQLLLHHARPPRQEEDHGAEQVTLTPLNKTSFSLLSTRRQIRVDKVLVHENFNDSANDIALLRLGKDGLSGHPFF